MVDIDLVTRIVAEVGATEILPRFQTLRDSDIKQKAGPEDLVTIADVEAERVLTQRLSEIDLGSAVIGEENATADPDILRLLRSDKSLWIIDPVDGTINFANGKPGFAIIVAYVRNGVTLAGWIHDPLTRKTMTAVRGNGTWAANERLTVDVGLKTTAMSGVAYGRHQQELLADVLGASRKFSSVSMLTSGAIEYMAMAERRRHFLIADKSFPWDHAAGALIVEEAGGVAGFTDGTAYDPRVFDRPVLVCSSQPLFDTVRSVLQ